MDLGKKRLDCSRHLSKVFSSCLQTISSAVMGSPVLLLATTMLPSLQSNKTLSKSAVCNGSKIPPPALKINNNNKKNRPKCDR